VASQTTYTCDFCGATIDKRDLDAAAFGIRIARENCVTFWDDHGECCKRCQHIIVDAVREATQRCKEVARG
jgi:hypothetical protein